MARAVLLKRCPGCPPETALQPIENFHRLRDAWQTYCRRCQRVRVDAAWAGKTVEQRRAAWAIYKRHYRSKCKAKKARDRDSPVIV